MVSTKPSTRASKRLKISKRQSRITSFFTNPHDEAQIPTTEPIIEPIIEPVIESKAGSEVIEESVSPCFFENKAPVADTPPLSEEQEEIVQSVLDRNNTVVVAVAGAGKTTNSLEVAKRFYEKHGQRTLILTYNSRLKIECRERIIARQLQDAVEAHSYHAMASKFFTPFSDEKGFGFGGPDDCLLHKALISPPSRPIDFGLVIIDEAQDMNDLFYQLVCHLLENAVRPMVMLILGDPFQRIFPFNGSTLEYLISPQKYFGNFLESPTFTTLRLSICWRTTHEIAAFMNEYVSALNLEAPYPEWWEGKKDKIMAWWGTGIRADPARPPAPGSIEYIRGPESRSHGYVRNAFTDPVLLQKTRALFDQYENSEVALLATSLKSDKSPIGKLIDKLGAKKDENWLVLSHNGYSTDETAFARKRVASTIHKFKGLERKVIVVVGMNSYIEIKNKDDPLYAFNLFYVACTRAKEKLIISSPANLPEFATFRKYILQHDDESVQRLTVTKVLEYTPFDEILSVKDNLFNLYLTCSHPQKCTLFERTHRLIEGREKGTVEDVSAFIGTAVHLRVAIVLGGGLPHVTGMSSKASSFDPDMSAWVEDILQRPPGTLTWEEILKYAIAFESVQSGYTHYWRQLKDNIKSVPDGFLDRCVENVLNVLYDMAFKANLLTQSREQKISLFGVIEDLKTICEVEVPVSIPVPYPWFTDIYDEKLVGQMDIILGNQFLIEVKVTNSIKQDHLLQAQMYRALTNQMSNRTGTPLTPIVLVANRAEAFSFDMKLQPAHASITADEEFLYRMLRRKCRMPWEKQEMLRDFGIQ